MTTKKRTTSYSLKNAEKEFGKLTFGSVLRAHRLSEEMTLAEMSELLGISKQNLCDLEKGRKIPSPSRAASIAENLQMMPESFIQLALQDQLDKDELQFSVQITATRKAS